MKNATTWLGQFFIEVVKNTTAWLGCFLIEVHQKIPIPGLYSLGSKLECWGTEK